ncbi:hypothetical protein EDB86DRAFT_2834721 [Lactarius hatsudake]|nr:hypothetical protein EDB86DRAFT_2834721 [Lactarius hatsudake]
MANIVRGWWLDNGGSHGCGTERVVDEAGAGVTSRVGQCKPTVLNLGGRCSGVEWRKGIVSSSNDRDDSGGDGGKSSVEGDGARFAKGTEGQVTQGMDADSGFSSMGRVQVREQTKGKKDRNVDETEDGDTAAKDCSSVAEGKHSKSDEIGIKEGAGVVEDKECIDEILGFSSAAECASEEVWDGVLDRVGNGAERKVDNVIENVGSGLCCSTSPKVQVRTEIPRQRAKAKGEAGGLPSTVNVRERMSEFFALSPGHPSPPTPAVRESCPATPLIVCFYFAGSGVSRRGHGFVTHGVTVTHRRFPLKLSGSDSRRARAHTYKFWAFMGASDGIITDTSGHPSATAEDGAATHGTSLSALSYCFGFKFVPSTQMPPSTAQLNAAARARAGRQRQRQITLLSSSESENDLQGSGLDEEETNSRTDGIEELAGPELTQSLEREMEREADAVRQMTLFDKITHSGDNWKRAESHIRGYYTGNSERTQRREKHRLNTKAESDDKTRKRHTVIHHSLRQSNKYMVLNTVPGMISVESRYQAKTGQ